MEVDDPFEKRRLRVGDVLDGLARHGLWQEADEVAGVARLERYPYFTVSLEAANPGAVPGARIDNDEGAFVAVDFNARRRSDTDQGVVHRPRQLAAIHDQLEPELQHVRRQLRPVFMISLGAPLQNIAKKKRALAGVRPIVPRVLSKVGEGGREAGDICVWCKHRVDRTRPIHWNSGVRVALLTGGQVAISPGRRMRRRASGDYSRLYRFSPATIPGRPRARGNWICSVRRDPRCGCDYRMYPTPV